MDGLSPAEIVAQLQLAPHPEGGHFRETFRDEHGTAILYLLEAGECSHWHRVIGSSEIWHHYAGGPLALTVSPDGHDAQAFRLGPTSRKMSSRRLSSRRAGGKRQNRLAIGHWWAARLPPRLTLRILRWRHPIGGPCRDLQAAVEEPGVSVSAEASDFDGVSVPTKVSSSTLQYQGRSEDGWPNANPCK